MKKSSNYFEAVNSAFWCRIGKSVQVNNQSLSIFRIITGCFLLLFYESFSWLSEFPDALFTPPIMSLANFTSGFPNSYVMKSIDVARLFLIMAIIFGIKTRSSTFLYVALTVICNSFLYSLGKINHDSNLLMAMLIVLSFSGWGLKLSLIPDSRIKYDSQMASLAILAVIISFGMFTAGFEKASQWIDFDLHTSGFASWFYQGYIANGRDYFLAPYIPRLPFYLFELLDYTAVIFELSPFVFLLISKRAWHSWLLIACIFHLLNILTLNISFTGHFLVYMAFIDYSGSFKWLSARMSYLNMKLALSLATGSVFILHFGNLIFRDGYYSITDFISSDYSLSLSFSIEILLWIVAIFIFGKRIIDLYNNKVKSMDQEFVEANNS
ncbi:MAG TPA: hypothetical protein VK921_03515 [Anditalea sp.]|nr:hypothetical protein [Anditalea sp.]